MIYRIKRWLTRGARRENTLLRYEDRLRVIMRLCLDYRGRADDTAWGHIYYMAATALPEFPKGTYEWKGD